MAKALTEKEFRTRLDSKASLHGLNKNVASVDPCSDAI